MHFFAFLEVREDVLFLYYSMKYCVLLDGGKHVLCEKPLCVNLKQVEELVDYARSGKYIQVRKGKPQKKVLLLMVGPLRGGGVKGRPFKIKIILL